MAWTEMHGRVFGSAFQKVLGNADQGAIAFARCLTADLVERLAHEKAFAPAGWLVWRVADAEDLKVRTITADRAVELRESKGDATLLLVDTGRAGAGMDGIYSAAQEVQESDLFDQARRLAGDEITSAMSRDCRQRAEQGLKRARGFGGRISVSHWTEFDFLLRVAAEQRDPGELLYLVGLWPAQKNPSADWARVLDLSRLFVERLLGTAVAGLTPAQRIESLKLLDASQERLADLERFLRSAATKPVLMALQELAHREHLWINALQMESIDQIIQEIELLPWRTNTRRIAKWSGLIEEGDSDQPPVLILKSDDEGPGDYSNVEVRWKARPGNLERGAVAYRVVIVTDMDEELAGRELVHSGKREEKCRFTNDDFSMLSADALISAKVVVSVIGNDIVEAQETEEFTIRFGKLPERPQSGGGKEVRTLSEGVIELAGRDEASELASTPTALFEASKGFVQLRTRERGKSFRVFRPALIREVEQHWSERSGTIGRWRVKVRASGARAGNPDFVPFLDHESASAAQSAWDRAASASRRMADRFATCGGGVAQIYDDRSKGFEAVVKEYMLAWAALLDDGAPVLALANTVEVQSLSGRTIGLIVLPGHPLRVAWHVAYDSLVLNTAFEQGAAPKNVREEFKILDGSMFPAFLPGLQGGSSFVYADTLRFHAVGMVPDDDKEPKAAVAILARALGESEAAEAVPTVGRQSAEVLGDEILKYLDCHNTAKLVHVHALRPGDGLTVARSLGRVQERYRPSGFEDETDEREQKAAPAFVLELYSSYEQRGLAGRFIAEAREKRRRGAGILAPEDHWMLDSVSLPGGMNLPRLRWARKSVPDPTTAAHLAVAFDTFDSRVGPDGRTDSKARPLFAYGLLSFFDREYTDDPSPLWRSTIVASTDGEKHPSDRAHSERLVRLQHVIQQCVARNLGADIVLASLRTEILPEKAQSLHELHRLCDWVITLDRNAGIEYFDSPRSNKEIYDAYVIDCVPEREDLGCLQLITSTSNLEEVRSLLDRALEQMGLIQSRRNAEFLLEHLKALSGRLAIRLTGQRAPTSEVIALALSHADCRLAPEGTSCWMSLRSGFLISVDDVLDLIPPLSEAPADKPATGARPNLIYVTVIQRRGLLIEFVEVKYVRHLRAARSADVMEGIRHRVASLRERWDGWYSGEGVPAAFRAIRRAKLARVLRFYADKAHRHHLPKGPYDNIVSEIDRMIEKGADYTCAAVERPDRGWVFCPEYAGISPLEISTADWSNRIFLFGPGLLPDSDLRQEPFGPVLAAANGSEAEIINVTAREYPGDDEQAEIVRADSSVDPGQTALPLVLGTDLLTGAEVRWALTIKGNPHLLVAGLPGMGKTTCLLNLCQQMREAGVRPIVFSYHQDIDERLQEQVGSVRFVDYHGLGFNPLQVINRESRMAYLDVAGALRDIFVAIYPELGDIQGEAIRKAIKESFSEKGWGDLNVDVAHLQEPLFVRFVEILRANPKPDRGLRTLLGRLEELADYGFFELAGPHESLWESDQPIVIRIHATQNDNLQKAFASLIFYGLYKDMFRRGIQDHITHAVVFDEAHRAARLRLIPTMAKECRKYGISLVLASQEAKDFNNSLFSAIANYLVLRLNEADAKALVRNVASSDQERSLIDKIKQLERFKALYFSEGRKKPSPVSLQAG